MEAHRNVSCSLDSTSMTDHVTVALVVCSSSSSFAMAILAKKKRWWQPLLSTSLSFFLSYCKQLKSRPFLFATIRVCLSLSIHLIFFCWFTCSTAYYTLLFLFTPPTLTMSSERHTCFSHNQLFFFFFFLEDHSSFIVCTVCVVSLSWGLEWSRM